MFKGGIVSDRKCFLFLSTVPHGVWLRGRGPVQLEVPLLPKQGAGNRQGLLICSELSIFEFIKCTLMCACLLTMLRASQVEVTEKNPDGYLSAAEIPLSRLYLYMAGVFFTAALVWVYNLMKHRYTGTMKK